MNGNGGATIEIRFQPANPGQFFACCGLLELSDRLWDGGAEGWFERNTFQLHPAAGSPVDVSFSSLVDAIAGARVVQLDPDDDFASAVELPSPFGLRLDWWKDTRAGGERLKVWAGSMRSVRIARAMQAVLGEPIFKNGRLFDRGMVVHDPAEPTKKVEPFYFDARRGSNAQPLDIGFSPDTLQMTSLAYPAVEFLCLVGLQRFRPAITDSPRVFEYYPWLAPLDPMIASLSACGLLPLHVSQGFRFENAFRTDQRKHKGFTGATPI